MTEEIVGGMGSEFYGQEPEYGEDAAMSGADPDLGLLLAASGQDEVLGADAMILAGLDPLAAMGYQAAGAAPTGNPQLRMALTMIARQRAVMKKQALKQVAMRRGVAVVNKAGGDRRVYPLNFFFAAVPAGGIQDVNQQPQVLWRGERFVVASDIGGFFEILDIKVGKDSVFASGGRMLARVFSETADGVRLLVDTASISQIVQVTVRNRTAVAQDFFATWIGTAIDR